jgi:hypothetical protein
MARFAYPQVMDRIDADGYYALITERLARLPMSATSNQG